MQLDFHGMNSARMVRQATVCMVALALVVGFTRFGTGSSYDVTTQGFKVENTSSPLRQVSEPLPWLKDNQTN